MKTKIVLVISFFLISCNPKPNPTLTTSAALAKTVAQPLEVEHILKIGQESINNGESVSVQFNSVSEDSRCPIGAECIWEGNAEVNLKVSKVGKADLAITLNTVNNDARFPKYVKYQNYKIELVKLSPHPIAGEQIEQNDYEVIVKVSEQVAD